MSVVAKALGLLSHFDPQTPELGLSQIVRLAKRDKATTYRHLSALAELGFVEQNPVSKAYRIGPAVLHLATLRELAVPRRVGADGPLRQLAAATGETAHVSVLSGSRLRALSSCEAQEHSIRAVIDLHELPLHATASGICALAFGPAALIAGLGTDLPQFTAHTPTEESPLRSAVAAARDAGFARADRGFEEDICGFAAPLFDQTGHCAGTVAVACVASRLKDALEARILQNLWHASREITRNWGGTIPDEITARWQAAGAGIETRERVE